MSSASLRVAAILFLVVFTVEFGGLSLLRMIQVRDPGYMENPVRRKLFRAGHAHAGAWVIFALLGLLYVDQADLGDGLKAAVRTSFAAAPILAPLGFFTSVLPRDAQHPGRAIVLVYLGGLALAFATFTLGVGLLRAR
jgi:hypothetical protein